MLPRVHYCGCNPGRPVPHLLAHVAQVQRVVEAAHDVGPHLRDLEHLAQLLGVARDEVQERQPLVALGLLVRELHDAVVALAQRLHACSEEPSHESKG